MKIYWNMDGMSVEKNREISKRLNLKSYCILFVFLHFRSWRSFTSVFGTALLPTLAYWPPKPVPPCHFIHICIPNANIHKPQSTFTDHNRPDTVATARNCSIDCLEKRQPCFCPIDWRSNGWTPYKCILNRKRKMDISCSGIFSLLATFSQLLSEPLTWCRIWSALFRSIRYSSEASSRISGFDSFELDDISRLWCSSSVGFTSYTGERVQPLGVNRNPWFRKWSSELPTKILNRTRLKSSSRVECTSVQPRTI